MATAGQRSGSRLEVWLLESLAGSFVRKGVAVVATCKLLTRKQRAEGRSDNAQDRGFCCQQQTLRVGDKTPPGRDD